MTKSNDQNYALQCHSFESSTSVLRTRPRCLQFGALPPVYYMKRFSSGGVRFESRLQRCFWLSKRHFVRVVFAFFGSECAFWAFFLALRRRETPHSRPLNCLPGVINTFAFFPGPHSNQMCARSTVFGAHTKSKSFDHPPFVRKAPGFEWARVLDRRKY